MGIRKSLGLLVEHIGRFGPVRGTQIVRLKSQRSSSLATISSPLSGGSMFVRPGTSDMAIYDQIFLRPYLPRDRNYRTVIDCGANIGSTVRYWKAAYPEALVVAVEPDPDNFAVLQRNTEGMAGIHCVQAGVWPEAGKLDLEREGLGHSGTRTVADAATGNTDAVTIPGLMERFGMDRVSMLKIDIEGSEKELFSAGDLSWIARVDAIAIELHDTWKPGCGDAFFRAISPYRWCFSVHGEMILCERWEGPADHG